MTWKEGITLFVILWVAVFAFVISVQHVVSKTHELWQSIEITQEQYVSIQNDLKQYPELKTTLKDILQRDKITRRDYEQIQQAKANVEKDKLKALIK